MKTAALFPGQGALKAGMVRDWIDRSPLFAQADALLGVPLSGWLRDDAADLTDTAIQQPALFVCSMARWQMWRDGQDDRQDQGETAAYVAGHSMGEISALCAAGALTFADGLRLVHTRGHLMKQIGEARPGRMAAILKLSVEQIETVCQQVTDSSRQLVTIANDNCPGQLVIAGDEAAVNRVVILAKMMGGRAKMLPVPVASHCGWMAEIAEQFGRAVSAVPIVRPSIPIIGNVTAEPLDTPSAIRAELTQQLTHRVRWTESMRWLTTHDVTRIVDMGPGTVLAGLMKRIDPAVERVTMTDHNL